MSLSLFDQSTLQPKTFFDFAAAGDVSGAMRHLRDLPLNELELEVLKAGFSMIGRHHGKMAMVEFAIKQIGNKEPRHISAD